MRSAGWMGRFGLVVGRVRGQASGRVGGLARGFVGGLSAALLVVGCSAAPLDDDGLANGEVDPILGAPPALQVARRAGDDPPEPREPRPRPESPRPGPVCPAVHPTCVREPLPGAHTNELRALGCGAPVYYLNGRASGVLGGHVALCPDTAAVRARFSPVGYDCDACLGQAPAGAVYVYTLMFVGPNCQSGCGAPSAPWETLPSDGMGS